MKLRKDRGVSGQQGFTLVEVLLALAIAAIGFGVVLHSLGLQLTLVARCLERHQMMLLASEALETAMTNQTLDLEENEKKEEPIGDFGRLKDESEARVAQFVYSVSQQPVTADPRVQQVTVQVRGGRGQLRLSAYRLRVQRN